MNMAQLDIIKNLIHNGEVDQAIQELENLLSENGTIANKDNIYYLIGNAYRKQANWKEALNYYQKAIDINSDSPALQARKAVIDILEFYHKDMFNQ